MARDRIETVLRLRRLHEQRARAAMGAAAGAVIEAERAVERGWAALRGHRVDATDVVTLLLGRTQELALQEAVTQAQERHAGAVAAHHRAVAEWQTRRAEERAVERLLERRREAARLEAMAVEQRSMDELAILSRTRGAA